MRYNWPNEIGFAQIQCNASAFRMNTFKSVSKQRALTAFRMNTLGKTGGGEGESPTSNKTSVNRADEGRTYEGLRSTSFLH